MRTDTLSSSLRAVFRLLTSDCPRYAVARASICPFWGACNLRQFNYFRSDSPLTFTSFCFRFGDIGAAFWVWLFLVLQSPALSAPAGRLPSRANADSFFFVAVGVSLLWSCARCLASMSSFLRHRSITNSQYRYGLCIVVRLRAASRNVARPPLPVAIGPGSVPDRSVLTPVQIERTERNSTCIKVEEQ